MSRAAPNTRSDSRPERTIVEPRCMVKLWNSPEPGFGSSITNETLRAALGSFVRPERSYREVYSICSCCGASYDRFGLGYDGGVLCIDYQTRACLCEAGAQFPGLPKISPEQYRKRGERLHEEGECRILTPLERDAWIRNHVTSKEVVG